MNKQINKFFNEIKKFEEINKLNFEEINSKLNFGEDYMSDKLACLLNNRGKSNGFGIDFVKNFIENLNIKKSSLINATAIREYPLPSSLKDSNGIKNIDVLLMDLDSKDNIILPIENKYFTTDSENQLKDYNDFLKDYFENFVRRRQDKKEYKQNIVYLTLTGEPAKKYDKNYLRLSWLNDIENQKWIDHEVKSIYSILNELIEDNQKISPELEKFIQYLEYLKQIQEYSKKSSYKDFEKSFLQMISDIFVKVLRNLDSNTEDNKERIGFNNFKNKNTDDKITKISHSSIFKSLSITFSLTSTLNNLQLKINVTKNKSFYIPLNIHIDQINHLFYVACFNIYTKVLKDKKLNQNKIFPTSKKNNYKIEKYENDIITNILKYNHIIRHIKYFIK